MRNAFADELVLLAKKDERVALLSGDIGNRLFDPFKKISGDRFINCGIAEQNMMSVAAGMALSGFRPFVYTITPFATVRCLEQIKIDVCYHEAPVVIVGTGSGLSYAPLGPTHHSLEDMAVLRALPNILIFAPCDEYEMRAGMHEALASDRPVYMRIGKKGEPVIHPEIPQIKLGQSLSIRSGEDVCIISAGTIISEVIETASLLEGHGISCAIENFHTIKPLDESRLKEIMNTFSLVCVAEEHSKIGGLYSSISEWAASRNTNSKLISFGCDDNFLHEVKSQKEARDYYGLSAPKIADKIFSMYQEL